MEGKATVEFSVLLPVYHGDEFQRFHQVWTSIIDNTLSPTEIVVVFDGPVTQQIEDFMDHTAKNDESVKVVKIEKNLGLANALNVGLDACHCGVVVRCDADDINRKDRFERLLCEFVKDPELKIVGSWVTEDSDGDLLTRKVPLCHEEIRKYSLYRNPFNHMTVAFKKDAVDAVGGYPMLPQREDYGLWLILLSKGCKAKNLPNELVIAQTGREMYRRRGGSGTLLKEWMLFKVRATCGNTSIVLAVFSLAVRSFLLSTPLWIKPILYKTFLRQ